MWVVYGHNCQAYIPLYSNLWEILSCVVRIQRCLLRWHLDPTYKCCCILHKERSGFAVVIIKRLLLSSWMPIYIYNPITYLYIYIYNPISVIPYICIYIYIYMIYVQIILSCRIHIGSIVFLVGFPSFSVCLPLTSPSFLWAPALRELTVAETCWEVGQYCWEVTCRMLIKHGGLGYRHTFILFVHTCSYMFRNYASNMSCIFVHMHARYSTSNIHNIQS